jgi:hypothetical protein
MLRPQQLLTTREAKAQESSCGLKFAVGPHTGKKTPFAAFFQIGVAGFRPESFRACPSGSAAPLPCALKF